jgi:tRNA(fMet)-specific endonuclease VapC
VALILDTSFIVAAERDAGRKIAGPAAKFLTAHPDERFFITFTVAGELACGHSASALDDWKRLCRPYAVIPWHRQISWQYGLTYRQLQKSGRLIGANDLWIAATAIVHQMAVVTNNVQDFRRVKGLSVVSF